MSATNRGAVRDELDYYATPPELAALICQAVKRDFMPNVEGFILEPGSGAAGFLPSARCEWPEAQAFGIEADPARVVTANEASLEAMQDNVLNPELWADVETGEPSRFQLILGNPPFKQADAFIPFLHGLLDAGGLLALLLRLNFLGGQARFRDLWSCLPPTHIYVLPQRPGFTPDGKTDATEYMVALWRHGHQGPTTLSFLDNTATTSRWSATAPPAPAAPTPAAPVRREGSLDSFAEASA